MSYIHAQPVSMQRKSHYTKTGIEEGVVESIDFRDGDYRLHIDKCPACNVLIECNWQSDPENRFEGWCCSRCDEEIDNEWDPTPVEQWEVTEGSGERERWEQMIRRLP